MKLIAAGAEQIVFALDWREKQLLLQVLQLYPLMPEAYERPSKSSDNAESQKLLGEALAEQRRENKNLMAAFLKSDKVFRDHEKGCRFTLPVSQIEWLLQVLNDVRVGGWVISGSPEEINELPPDLPEKDVPYFLASHVAGLFSFQLVNAAERAQKSGEKE